MPNPHARWRHHQTHRIDLVDTVGGAIQVKTWWRNDTRFAAPEQRERWQCSLPDRRPLATAQGHDTEADALAAITAALQHYQRP